MRRPTGRPATARARVVALDVMVTAVGGLEPLRGRVLSRDISWDRAVSAYSTFVEPGFDVQSALTALQAGQLAPLPPVGVDADADAGLVLEIDDRGLGLDACQLDAAHRTLTDPDRFDPTRHDRLGLHVVGRLAARHGIGVTLGPSPCGGTTALVLLPEGVLAEGEDGASRPPRVALAAPREENPEEMRAVFGAFRRGLARGRRGLPLDSDPTWRTDNEKGKAPADAP